MDEQQLHLRIAELEREVYVLRRGIDAVVGMAVNAALLTTDNLPASDRQETVQKLREGMEKAHTVTSLTRAIGDNG